MTPLFILMGLLCFLLLVICTKEYQGTVTVGDLFFCAVAAIVPICNVLAVVYYAYVTLRKSWLTNEKLRSIKQDVFNFFDKEVW